MVRNFIIKYSICVTILFFESNLGFNNFNEYILVCSSSLQCNINLLIPCFSCLIFNKKSQKKTHNYFSKIIHLNITTNDSIVIVVD